MSEKRKSTLSGMALLEGACWLAVLLPVALVGVSVVASVHDRNALQVIPDAALREVFSEGVRWVPDGLGGRYEANVPELRQALASLSLLGVSEAAQGVFKAQNISAKACFWIYSVDSSNGNLEAPISSECDARGPLGPELSLTWYIEQEVARCSGIQLREEGSAARFVDRIVIMGLVVGGDSPDLLDTTTSRRIEFGAVSYPRQEIAL